MRDTLDQLRRAFDADSVAEKNLAIRAGFDSIESLAAELDEARIIIAELWYGCIGGPIGGGDGETRAVITPNGKVLNRARAFLDRRATGR